MLLPAYYLWCYCQPTFGATASLLPLVLLPASLWCYCQPTFGALWASLWHHCQPTFGATASLPLVLLPAYLGIPPPHAMTHILPTTSPPVPHPHQRPPVTLKPYPTPPPSAASCHPKTLPPTHPHQRPPVTLKPYHPPPPPAASCHPPTLSLAHCTSAICHIPTYHGCHVTYSPLQLHPPLPAAIFPHTTDAV